MSTIAFIIIASIAESLVSFFASLAVILNEERVRRGVHWVISLAVGVILGAVFLDILPEVFEFSKEPASMMPWVLGGFLFFFILEKLVFWYHSHGHEDEYVPETAGYLALIGDAIHNFIDGIIIAFTFMTDIRLGILTTFAVALHEIPQEVSDFSIMIHSGFSTRRALFFNVFVSVTTLVGAFVGYFITSSTGVLAPLLAVVAGNFLYLAAADLIPELHHRHGSTSSVIQVGLVLLGVALIYFSGQILPE